MTTITLIPLVDLTLSPLNPRQIVAEDEIEAMAASLASGAGLLQNLLGQRMPDGSVQIVAGGKRLRALQKLAAEGWKRHIGQQRIDYVPVQITEDPLTAQAWAGAENTARTALHPADEIRAYNALRLTGLSPGTIARTYAVTESQVNRMLKLSGLPAAALDALRAGEITLDVAQALTVAPDPATCLSVLAEVRGRDVHPQGVRNMLLPRTINANSARARYLGLDAYVAGGGQVTTDLFTGTTHLHDDGLLIRLSDDKARLELATFAAEQGWAWSDLIANSYSTPAGSSRIPPTPGELTEADAEEMDRLMELANAELLDEAGQSRLAKLEARADGDWTDDDRATGGLYGWIGHDGLTLSPGWQRRTDAPAADDGAGDDTARAPAPEAEKPDFPANLAADLRVLRLRAMQVRLMDQPELLLDLLAYQIEAGGPSWATPFDATIMPQNLTPEKPDGLNDDDRFTIPSHSYALLTADGFTAFRARGKKHRNAVLTHALARSFRLTDGPLATALAAQLKPDAREFWTPTAAGFLARVSNASYLDSLWAELTCPDLPPTGFLASKKADKAKKIEALFMDLSFREGMALSRAEGTAIDTWLPAPLIWTAPDPTPETQEDAA